MNDTSTALHTYVGKTLMELPNEAERVKALYRQLIAAERFPFPQLRQSLACPTEKGVYVIYCMCGKPLHVGRTPRGQRGLQQRLQQHMQGASSFVRSHLVNNGRALRNGYSYQYLVVNDRRMRAFLENYASGKLCPAYIR